MSALRFAPPATAHAGAAVAMREGTGRDTTRLFWGTIAFGLLVPVLLVRVVAAVVAGGRSVGGALAELPPRLFRPGYNLFALALLTAVPFVVLAFVIRRGLRSRANSSADDHIGRIGRVIGAAVAVTGTVLAVQIDIWFRTFGSGRHVSTAGAALLMLPFLALLALAAGYYAGSLVGWAVARWRK